MGYADIILFIACQISGNEHIDRSTPGLHLRSILSKYSSSFACKLVDLRPSFFMNQYLHITKSLIRLGYIMIGYNLNVHVVVLYD